MNDHMGNLAHGMACYNEKEIDALKKRVDVLEEENTKIWKMIKMLRERRYQGLQGLA